MWEQGTKPKGHGHFPTVSPLEGEGGSSGESAHVWLASLLRELRTRVLGPWGGPGKEGGRHGARARTGKRISVFNTFLLSRGTRHLRCILKISAQGFREESRHRHKDVEEYDGPRYPVLDGSAPQKPQSNHCLAQIWAGGQSSCMRPPGQTLVRALA